MASQIDLEKLKSEDQRKYLDVIIGQYFRSLGKDYEDGGSGAFFKYCDSNGFDKNDLEEEFRDNYDKPDDFMFMEFFDPPEDEDTNYPEFPLNPSISDKDARNKKILEILKYCFDNGKPPSFGNDSQSSQASQSQPKRRKSSAAKRLSQHYNTPKNILEIVIETDKKTQKECHKLYSSQCPLLYKEEDVLKRCFAISIKNNRYPFLINLVDSFLRDKSLYQRAHSKKNKDLQMVKWRTTSKYFHAINKEQKKMADTLASGVDTFLRRGCTSWDYGPAKLARIQDSVEDISYYVLMMNNFVQNLINNHNTTPFQIDFPIAINKVKTIKIGKQTDELSDDSDNEPSDDDNDDQKFMDEIGDIEEKLKSNNLCYHSFEMDQDLKDESLVTRLVNNAFNKYKEKLKDGANYPQKRRFIMFIDRRQADNDKANDKLTIFDAPKNCNSIPDEQVPEWFFNATKTCIIPGKAEGNGQMNKKNIIRADSGVGGQIITISFCVEAEDIIKCYMFWMGRYTRIYPEDLGLILPEIFDMNANNNKTFQAKEQNSVFSKLKIIDTDYESFYNQATYKKHVDFPKTFA
mmetsp:Transcript_63468/g.57169  ORF Transcript_63468/g.57169 Transcript_63468/m.57169 type:complete len:575 (-) Transcript_63468:158-1882(-)|eukprot:CAMPEP_0201581544 /NCGR_PEP_ID=MMETSP0190_2-20130828/70831_1 /ASSEMBLY_ACC=CAM_ASM_000263 /TAXON_ID=37353 /ORGANISM="Rosalina sp." /LENGTH=574 /DNA_ID=CAMNT_0048019761 /DNA_START=21 /DNA_END=1745 /DNA_ORIENTATION=-